MKSIFTFLITVVFSISLFAQNTGDIAIIGTNFDDPDEILFVTLVDIDASTDIYFTDYKWDGSAWVTGGADGWLKYTAPAEGLAAGDVVKITLGSPYSANIGTVASDGGLFRLINSNNSGDEIYAYLGTDKENPTTFLFALNTTGSWGANELLNTGLTDGDNALVVCSGIDNSKYTGTRTGTASELKSAIADISSNWSSSSGRYTLSTTRFNISGFVQKPTSLTIENITSTKIRISWTKPSGLYGTDWDGVTLFVRQGSSNDGSVTSADGNSYTASLTFGSGTSFGSAYTVANQTTDSDGNITVTNLTEGETYYIVAYAYKTVSGTNNDNWSNATIELSDEAEVQGVTNFDEYPATALVDISWDNYFGAVSTWWDEVLVLAKANSEVDGTPTGDGSTYSANAIFGSGSQIGVGNYVVYKGTGTSVKVTGLTNGTTYHFRAFVRYGSDWTDAEQYKSTSSTPVPTIEEPSVSELIISEVNDVLHSDAAYMELYNNTTSAIKLDSVFINYYTLGHTYRDYKYTIGKRILSAGGYYVIAQSSQAFYNKYGKYPDGVFYQLFTNSTKDGMTLETQTNGIIDRFNDVPGATVSREENHLYERVNYPNNGSDLSNDWSDEGYNQEGTPGEANSNSLPVELTYFTAKIIGENIVLNWETATEVNNYGFEIERSSSRQGGTTPDKAWETIGFVEGHGNSNSPNSYSFVDNNDLIGAVQYRLKQTDFDGGFEYSVVVTVEPENKPKFKLSQNYPNPFNPSTTISYTIPTIGKGEMAKVKLVVYDVLGRKVATLVNGTQKAGNYKIVFNASTIKQLSSGIYFYSISVNEFREVKKMNLLK